MAFGISFSKNKNKYSDTSSTNSSSSDNQNQFQINRGSGSQSVTTRPWWEQGTENLYGDISGLMSQYGTGKPTPAQQPYISTLNDLANTDQNASAFLKKNVNPALQGLAMQYSPFATGANYSLKGATPQATAEGVTAGTAFDSAGKYREAYGTGVLDPALADFDEGVNRAANSFRAGSIQGAPNTRQSVAAGVMGADAARGRGALSAQIRTDNLDKSFGFGGNDAGMKLNADTFSAGGRNAASLANSQMAQQDRMAQLQADIQSDDRKMSALGNMANLVQAQGDNALAGDTAASQAAIAALQAAGIPLEDALALIQAMQGGLNTAVPGFGTESEDISVGAGSSSGTSTGTSTTNSSGTSSGSRVGANASK